MRAFVAIQRINGCFHPLCSASRTEWELIARGGAMRRGSIMGSISARRQTAERTSSLGDFIKSRGGDAPEGYAPPFSDWLLNGEKAGDYRETLNFCEMEKLHAVVQWLKKQSNAEAQKFINEKDISIVTYADKALRPAKDLPSKPVREKQTLFPIDRAINMLDREVVRAKATCHNWINNEGNDA